MLHRKMLRGNEESGKGVYYEKFCFLSAAAPPPPSFSLSLSDLRGEAATIKSPCNTNMIWYNGDVMIPTGVIYSIIIFLNVCKGIAIPVHSEQKKDGQILLFPTTKRWMTQIIQFQVCASDDSVLCHISWQILHIYMVPCHFYEFSFKFAFVCAVKFGIVDFNGFCFCFWVN